ncbi:MAG TPA: AAA family ATPase, partial [Planctomycetota bacterium]|nr:AAA family ATPase [Planctomycetota bacterium]
DAILRSKIIEFVSRGDFGLASGQKPDGTYERIWFKDPVAPDEIAFESGVFLLMKPRAQALEARTSREPVPVPGIQPVPKLGFSTETGREAGPGPAPGIQTKTIRLVGTVSPEVWNRLGTKILPKLRSGSNLKIGVDFSVTVNANSAGSLASDLRQILADLGLAEMVRIE